MTIAEQLKLVEAALADWCRTNNGRVYIASDAQDCLDQLRSRPASPTCAVLWYGWETRGDIPELGRTDQLYKLVISRGRGMNLVSGDSLTKGTAGGKPMFDLMQEAGQVVFGLRLDDLAGNEDSVPRDMGAGPWEVNGWLLDAMEVRFSLANQVEVEVP